MTITENLPTEKDEVHDFLDPSVISESLKRRGITPDWFLVELLNIYDQAKAEADFKAAANILQRIHQFIAGSVRLAQVKRTLTAEAPSSGHDPNGLNPSDPAARLLALTRNRTPLSRLISDRAVQYERRSKENQVPEIFVDSTDPDE
jgi:hypothetical protein